MFSPSEIDEIKSAFQLLGIKPTIDRGAIKTAYRKAAMRWHPDRFQSKTEKDRAHHEFVARAKARDTVLEAIAEPRLLDYLSKRTKSTGSPSSSFAYSESRPKDPPRKTEPKRRKTHAKETNSKTRKTAYEAEWKVFVEDENAYFDLMSSTSATLGVLFQTFAVSMSVSIAMGAMVALVIVIAAVLGLGIVAALSASVAIPILGWFALFFILGWAGEKFGEVAKWLGQTIDISAEKMLACVSRTGYPTRGFWVATGCAVGITLLVVIALVSFDFNGLAITLSLFLLIMTGSLIAVNDKIQQRLRHMDEAFSDIRATTSYALVLAEE